MAKTFPKWLTSEDADLWTSVIGWPLALAGIYRLFTDAPQGNEFWITVVVSFVGIVLVGGLPELQGFLKNVRKLSVSYILFILLLIGVVIHYFGPDFLFRDTVSLLVGSLVVGGILSPLIIALIKND